ncbi:putative mitochondrial protein [Tanacetum coccineum]
MDEEDEDDEENVENKEGSHIHLDSVEVSLNSLLGFTSPRTMKIRGILGGVVVTVLINSGATHNFLSKVLVARLGLCVSGNNSVGVMLGNEGFEESVRLCKGVVLSLSGLQIIEDFFPFELESKLPKGLTEYMEVILQPTVVLGVRKDSKGNHFVLVRWKDLPGYEATWEPFETMRQQFPDLHLEDKVVLQDGDIDTKWDKVYQRCNKQLKWALGN